MDYKIQACTDIGNVKNTNQDSYTVKIINTPAGKLVFAIMCDGMGGLSKGEVASATLVTAFEKWVNSTLVQITSDCLTEEYIRTEWNRILIENNEKIKAYGKKTGVNLGTTATVMLLTSDKYYVANVGDTRAYEITSDKISIITKDQTVVAREVEQGLITQEQADTDPRRSVLLQCIGASDVVYPDLFTGDISKDAVYMLCTDGFRHEIKADDIFNSFKPQVMIKEDVMEYNIRYLINLDKQRKERDNISVITIRTFS